MMRLSSVCRTYVRGGGRTDIRVERPDGIGHEGAIRHCEVVRVDMLLAFEVEGGHGRVSYGEMWTLLE